MDKKQLRLYAKKFEGLADIARIVFGIAALLGLIKFMDWFSNTSVMMIACAMYVGILSVAYWWVRREWRALFAPPPKPVRKKPAPPKETP